MASGLCSGTLTGGLSVGSVGRPLVLASASPRRQELLATLVDDFDVVHSGVAEVVPDGLWPDEVAAALALAKARDVFALHAGSVVLGADTVVAHSAGSCPVVLGKPASDDDAHRMLASLSGREHDAITGVAVVWPGLSTTGVRVETVTTRVSFRALRDDEIAAYVASREPLDKAGAYAIQGGASVFVERVDGDYYNVVGLSLRSVHRLLRGLVCGLRPPPDAPVMPYPVLDDGGCVRTWDPRRLSVLGPR